MLLAPAKLVLCARGIDELGERGISEFSAAGTLLVGEDRFRRMRYAMRVDKNKYDSSYDTSHSRANVSLILDSWPSSWG